MISLWPEDKVLTRKGNALVYMGYHRIPSLSYLKDINGTKLLQKKDNLKMLSLCGV